MDRDLRRVLLGEFLGMTDWMIAMWHHGNPTDQEFWIASWMNWSFTKRWAWNALQRLLRELREKRQPVPPLLTAWAHEVAIGDRAHPQLRRGRPSDDDRDMRINLVVRVLERHQGRSHAAACKEVGEVVAMSTAAIKSICRRVLTARPFPVQK